MAGRTTSIREHLDDVGEGYFEHQRRACGFGLRLIGAGLACLVHAVVPSRCPATASVAVGRLHAELSARREGARGGHE